MTRLVVELDDDAARRLEVDPFEFIGSFASHAANGHDAEGPTTDDLRRAAERIERYADLRVGGTDACVIALAERIGDSTIFTLDRRHFAVVQSSVSEGLTILS